MIVLWKYAQFCVCLEPRAVGLSLSQCAVANVNQIQMVLGTRSFVECEVANVSPSSFGVHVAYDSSFFVEFPNGCLVYRFPCFVDGSRQCHYFTVCSPCAYWFFKEDEMKLVLDGAKIREDDYLGLADREVEGRALSVFRNALLHCEPRCFIFGGDYCHSCSTF